MPSHGGMQYYQLSVLFKKKKSASYLASRSKYQITGNIGVRKQIK